MLMRWRFSLLPWLCYARPKSLAICYGCNAVSASHHLHVLVCLYLCTAAKADAPLQAAACELESMERTSIIVCALASTGHSVDQT